MWVKLTGEKTDTIIIQIYMPTSTPEDVDETYEKN